MAAMRGQGRPECSLTSRLFHVAIADSQHFLAAIGECAPWGYFGPGENNCRDGYQSPPVEWGLNTDRRRVFFELVQKITGG